MREVLPPLVVASMSAPRSSSIFAISRRSFEAAFIRAVAPYLSAALTSAPRSSSIFAISRRSFEAAFIRAVAPYSSVALMSAPRSSRTSAVARASERAAMMRDVLVCSSAISISIPHSNNFSTCSRQSLKAAQSIGVGPTSLHWPLFSRLCFRAADASGALHGSLLSNSLSAFALHARSTSTIAESSPSSAQSKAVRPWLSVALMLTVKG
mmetsp:Transcript_115028/g.298224  ORF Transcript_115028/g.298224 Transcript_115028/m.298224 type:complete len:210 (-) Transcript_115028:324-953(-)